ncbi:unnamed protein product [Cylicostephanus goldi]|uniref:Uncharacterized protein n=1 Tax=Cylicostephanus goldi TaxID=71465 RepID=A0A3P7QS39_CYLGO|nr:unnamed protein product [Cylicostephanus goldi]
MPMELRERIFCTELPVDLVESWCSYKRTAL